MLVLMIIRHAYAHISNIDNNYYTKLRHNKLTKPCFHSSTVNIYTQENNESELTEKELASIPLRCIFYQDLQ